MKFCKYTNIFVLQRSVKCKSTLWRQLPPPAPTIQPPSLTMPTPRTTATHPTQSPSIERSPFTQTCTQNATPCTHRAQCTRNIYKKKSWYKKVHWTYNALQCLEMSRNAQEIYFISTRRSPSLQENYFAECNISTKTVPVVFKGSQIARQAANQLPASTWPSLSSRQAVQ